MSEEFPSETRVIVQMFGKKYYSRKFSISSQRFSNDEAEVTINENNIGDLRAVSVVITTNQESFRWYLKTVEIKNKTTGQMWSFPCYRWFDNTHGSHLLYPDKGEQDKWQISVPSTTLANNDFDGFYTLYDIVIQHGQSVWRVSKRYRELHRFYSKLLEEFPDVPITPFPPKALINMSKDVIECRRIDIQKFLCDVFSKSYMVHSALVKSTFELNMLHIDDLKEPNLD